MRWFFIRKADKSHKEQRHYYVKTKSENGQSQSRRKQICWSLITVLIQNSFQKHLSPLVRGTCLREPSQSNTPSSSWKEAFNFKQGFFFLPRFSADDPHRSQILPKSFHSFFRDLALLEHIAISWVKLTHVRMSRICKKW